MKYVETTEGFHVKHDINPSDYLSDLELELLTPEQQSELAAYDHEASLSDRRYDRWLTVLGSGNTIENFANGGSWSESAIENRIQRFVDDISAVLCLKQEDVTLLRLKVRGDTNAEVGQEIGVSGDAVRKRWGKLRKTLQTVCRDMPEGGIVFHSTQMSDRQLKYRRKSRPEAQVGKSEASVDVSLHKEGLTPSRPVLEKVD